MNVAAASREPCRLYGDFVPLAEVLLAIENGWRLIDDLAGDPLGASHALLQPPQSREAS
jgi:hypothetical protein